MKKHLKRFLTVGLACLLASTNVWAVIPNYYNETEYNEANSNVIREARGVVVENDPTLGYLTYRTSSGVRTANYYRDSIEVEKQPYYESADRIGYIDQLFPNFQFDPRDTTIDTIKPGDNVYLRFNGDGDITYISAYNEYVMRYGKVVYFDTNVAGSYGHLTIQDMSGQTYLYEVPMTTPITKKSKAYTLGSLKNGEWVKVLVAQRLLGAGVVEEEVMEIVVDDDYKTISGVYRGELLQVDSYRNNLQLKNTQALQKSGWGAYTDVATLSIDPRSMVAYYLGSPVSMDYISRSLRGTQGYVYAAIENFMGKDSAVKLNFQSKQQNTLPTTQVIYSAPGVMRLLTGETVYTAADTLVVRDKRLVDSTAVMVGDTVQVVLTGPEKAAVVNVLPEATQSGLQVFRGRIKQIATHTTFEVETFSLLEGNTWYYHPTPRTFAIKADTRFYKEGGLVTGGINDFLSHGENSEVSNVYTIIAQGDAALYVVDMPYTKEAIMGNVYSTANGETRLKDVLYYDGKLKKWTEWSRKNVGAMVEVLDNSIIIKNGKVVRKDALESGDKLIVMLEKSIKETATDTTTQPTVSGYLLLVQ